MIDFIEYVVSELKSKRLSKNNALSLIKQFILHSSTTGKASVIHPLVHTNTSDLSQQSYSSTFTGEEFFLDDHQVNMDGNQGIKILPGVVYLEMARTAVEQALPILTDSSILELRNTIWMQPIVVTESKQISIAILSNDNDQIDFEIYSQNQDLEGHSQEIIHCQGQAIFSDKPILDKLNIEQIKGKMQRGKLDSSSIYEAYTKMGLNYGPAHQVITVIYQGEEQLLAQLRLPSVLEADQNKYLLHPSLMDGALQSTIGLIADLNQIPSKPTVPFALENLRIISACTREMFVWVRYSQGSKPEDKIIKQDIDLCDLEGNICVQIQGFSSRMITTEINTGGIHNKIIGTLFAAPVWESSEITASSNDKQLEYTQHHIILCDLPDVNAKQLENKISHGHCLSLQSAQQKNIAERYSEIALSCFEQIQTVLRSKLQGKVLLQIVITNKQEEILFAGLSGLLKTAALENPQLIGQIILTSPQITADELSRQLLEDRAKPKDTIIKHEQGTPHVLRLKETQISQDKPKIIFKDQGVYLITGGLGSLGILFAKEILEQTEKARIILTDRSELTEKKQSILNQLPSGANRIIYRQVDITNQDQVKELVTGIKKEYNQLNGIIHCAGMISDNFILKKTSEEFKQVLAPKVTGTFNLDEASKDNDFDFLVLFSSAASTIGNPGQSDYASANGFMDQFAVYRNQLVKTNQRRGKTISINWPLWQDGGMNFDQAIKEQMQQATGISPMQTATGMNAFYRSLELQQNQTLVMEGDLAKMRQTLLAEQTVQPEVPIVPSKPLPVQQSPATEIDSKSLVEKTQEYLRKQFSAVLRLPSHKIEIQAPLEKYGINSILAMNLTSQLEKTFGSLSKTLLFEYQTIADLSEYFTKNYSEQLSVLLAVPETSTSPVKPVSAPIKTQTEPEIRNKAQRRFSRQSHVLNDRQTSTTSTVNNDPIAIVGISGRYPESINIEEYWHNLRDGKDCIIEVPKDRWDWREYYSEDRSIPGHHYSKWGGFISGVDEFDPRFFNISPREAVYIDPQERLFLQHAWMAVEDAGYTRTSLQIPHEQDLAGQVGVYVGVMYGEYNLSGSLASIANRVSYVLNLHGPSMTLDTMCSSSLTAVHLACQDLKLGRTNLAIAGGVNVSISPSKYLILSAGQFISGDGHCQSFGEGGDGYIPGEGVGAVILKRLSEAERDGNHIYGIIKGSALNHGGKTNGYTVPNPQAQASAISRALVESKVNPRHISYLEAHGTGTKLGDPIEIASMSKAFQQYTQDTGFCLIGSAKSNVGHCESAAGISGLTKVLLQMKYRQIVPSLHSARLNPNIDFQKTPFVVNQTLRAWDQPVIDGKQIPRIAGISSFGAGGSNAHIILQEYVPTAEGSRSIVAITTNASVIIPLSARTPEQLQQKALDLFNFIRTSQSEEKSSSQNPINLSALAYTLQVGREAMDERLGFMVNSVDQLAEKLQAYINGEQDIEDAYQGQVNTNKDTLSLFSTDNDFQETVDKWISQKKLSKLIELWTKGLELDWEKLYIDNKPQRISLPAYPFAKERYWVDAAVRGQISATGKTTALIHPLLHVNTSDLKQQSYSSTFSGEEFFIKDYQVNLDGGFGQKILPSAASLEMVRAAVKQALPTQQESSILELQNIVWGQPIVVKEGKKVTIALFADDLDDNHNKQIDFEIYSTESEQDVIHCQGQAVLNYQPTPSRLDITKIKVQMQRGKLDSNNLYNRSFVDMGMRYGQAYQGITAIYKGDNQLLAELRLPSSLENSKDGYILHPCMIESALQASINLITDLNQLSHHPILLFALESLSIVLGCTKDMYAWVRYSQGSQGGDKINKLDVDLCDQNGNVLAQMKGLSLQQLIISADYQSNVKLFTPKEYSISSLPTAAKPQAVKLNILNEVTTVTSISTSAAKPKSIQLINSQPIISATSIPANERNTSSVNVSLKTLNPSENALAVNQTFQKVGTVHSQEQIQQELKISLADALYLQPSEIDINKSFVDLGLDSIVGVEWVKVVNKQFDLEISATRVYDYSNIKAFATFIKQELKEVPIVPIVEQKPLIEQRPSVIPVNEPTPAFQEEGKVYSQEQIQQELKVSLADALYLQPSEIDINKSFIDLGLDSIVGVEWVKAVNKQFGLEISATRVYDYSNVKAFASFIKQELKGVPVVAVVEQRPSVPTIEPSMTFQEEGKVYSQEQIQQELKVSLADALYLQPYEIDINKSFIDLGLDSIVGVEWVKAVNKQFGLEISATRVYDYSNVKAFASFIKQELKGMPVSSNVEQQKVEQRPIREQIIVTPNNGSNISLLNSFPILKRKPRISNKISQHVIQNNIEPENDKIAIIGMSGRYPQASNLNQYWDNLAQGKNSITEIQPVRWDVNQYYDPDPTKKGKMYCKWLGMLDDAECFDPLFFQIPPSEAESMDPQHRIFLQESYKAFEDAGYSNSMLSNTKCGVYMGIMSNDYTFHLSKSKSSDVNITGNSFAIGAARIAYFLNLKGPAIPFDTACSSSLVAIHVACQGLLNREIDMALAGGVSLYLVPESYIGMCQAGMLSPQGQCKTFDDSANGFVPGEGVGTLVLKRLKDAERDNDFIYGVILGSGINQDGKTNGITAPSVNSQIELERDLYNRYKIDPETISYVEAHGTGTKLGDPIELEALSTVFKEKTKKKNFCAIGSVKSNIGHTSGAAGVASVQKVLLSMQHKTLVPTLNVKKENAIFDFKNSPFYVSREKQSWDVNPDSLRRASISAFGFSGTNAHIVLEEYVPKIEKKQTVSVTSKNVSSLIVLSARTEVQLKQKANNLLDFIRKSIESSKTIDLTDMAYTLQVGRESMRERLGFVVSSVDQLTEKLQAYVAGGRDIENVYQGQVARDKDSMSMFGTDTDLQNIVSKWISDKNFSKLLDLWVKGLDLDWSKLYSEYKPSRINLPTYPFANDRYWIDVVDTPAITQKRAGDIKVNVAPIVEEKIQKTHYQPIWKESALSMLSESGDKTLVNGPVLVLGTTDELYLAIKKQLEGSLDQNSLIFVKLDHSYQEIEPTIYTVNPDQEDHFHQLIENLKIKGQFPNKIIHQGLEPENIEKKEKIIQQLNYGVYALFNLCKALMKQKNQTSLQILSFFSSNSKITAPQNAALGGFFKTLTLENPKYLAKVVEIQSDVKNPEISISEKADLILNEFQDRNWSKNEVRYKFQNEKQKYIRYVRELTQFTPAESKIKELPLKQHGVYIISGGLGGLGFVFSEYLVKNLQCKLVLFGRSALKEEQEAKLNQLKAYNTEIIYLQADVSKLEDMEVVVKTTKTKFSQINGVIHSAGINKDSFILKKSKEEIEKVLEPKIYGTINLDLATRGENLDVFILFSSIAGVMGNLGQCDYAYGNHFLDSFAEIRENLKKEQKRFGKTLSINWPYWEEGGMNLSQDEIALAKKQAGICPLPTEVGIQYWEEFLRSDLSQGVALYGLHSKIKAYVAQESVEVVKNKPIATGTMDSAILLEKTEAYLKTLIGEVIKLAPERIDSRERFESFGIDSIIISKININLEKDLGAMSKTLFYEYSTIEELTGYLAQEARQALIHYFNLEDSTTELDNQDIEESEVKSQETVQIQKKYEDSEPIAIIGVHGHYPQSEDLDKYWENLKYGKDLVDLVPENRWNYEEYFDKNPEKAKDGKIYCKWGGFLTNVDKFDPQFFNISQEEANIMDPQERLFLESVWATIEDAGYTKESLKKRHPKAKSADVGVFVGVTTNTYSLLATEEWARGNKTTPSALTWSIANRVSYFFDFQGPSMPIDTACSSSSVAIHLACESLKRQECQVAIAGGVNLYSHPSKYHSLCTRRMLALGGKCRSFGAGDDGFVPGEGVGSILLKPLSKAIADQDHIYAVIAGSAFDHSGRSNGYSAPNPNSQANLIEYTLNKANISPETIGYVEGHGTGTQLGDSLEIVALTNAFQKQTKKKQFCPVGSVKANIGHSESAAGIAGVAKILLQMKYRQLVPTIHSEEVNPNIEFKETPFYLQHKLTPWESSPDYPRRALINSFGAGGVNACIVLEEYEKPKVIEETKEVGQYLVILSAKNEVRLQESVNRLLSYIGKEKNVNLANLSYTLQVGREAMPVRLAIVISDRSELMDSLKNWKQQKTSANIYQGNIDPRQGGKKSSKKDILRAIFEAHDLTELAKMWVAGIEVDWENLYPQNKPMRMILPTYPFAKERYWVSDDLISGKRTVSEQKNSQLHPLISYNSSNLREVSFSSLLSESEFYAQDHQVNREKIFPGSGFLEIACISGNIAGEQKVCKIQDIVWIHPLSFKKGSKLVQTFLKSNGNSANYQITSLDDDSNGIVHSEGRLFFQNDRNHSAVVEKSIPIKMLKEKCSKPQDSVYFYDLFKKAGFNYGSAFRTVQEFYISDSFALSKLKIADHLKADFDKFILHPSLLDGALQTVAGLIGSVGSGTPYLPFAIDEIEIIRSLPQTCYAYVEFADSEKQIRTDIKKFNIQLLNEEGSVLIKLKNFYARAFDKTQAK
ncbi:MAG: SDR family NAD(P)-dependent oxidoreductase [Bacteroidales bacterium]|nr:SDR family NAD(P)-dependent oxidoreductase [Bacteroidales bacterium]